jgi:hypothetical protein
VRLGSEGCTQIFRQPSGLGEVEQSIEASSGFEMKYEEQSLSMVRFPVTGVKSSDFSQ